MVLSVRVCHFWHLVCLSAILFSVQRSQSASICHVSVAYPRTFIMNALRRCL